MSILCKLIQEEAGFHAALYGHHFLFYLGFFLVLATLGYVGRTELYWILLGGILYVLTIFRLEHRPALFK